MIDDIVVEAGCSSCDMLCLFRFPPAAASFILQQFSQYGNIQKHVVRQLIILGVFIKSIVFWRLNALYAKNSYTIHFDFIELLLCPLLYMFFSICRLPQMGTGCMFITNLFYKQRRHSVRMAKFLAEQ